MNTIKTLTKWTANTLVVTLVLFAVFFVIAHTLLGWRFNTVMSGSMGPTLKAGGVVATQAVDPETIEVGDIITYKSPELGMTVVHRVTEKHQGSHLMFQTKGDANENPDPHLVPAENVVSKVSFHLPLLGHVQQFVTSGQGMALLTVVPGLVIMSKGIQNIRTEISKLRNARREAAAARVYADGLQGLQGLRTEDWLAG